jgi:hypothetical protein
MRVRASLSRTGLHSVRRLRAQGFFASRVGSPLRTSDVYGRTFGLRAKEKPAGDVASERRDEGVAVLPRSISPAIWRRRALMGIRSAGSQKGIAGARRRWPSAFMNALGR